MKKMNRALVYLLLAAMLLSAFGFFGCGQVPNGEIGPEGPGKEGDEVVEPPKYLIYPDDLGDSVEIHTEDQAGYLNDSYNNIAEYIPPIANTERSYPKEIVLSWRVNENEDLPSVEYRVFVSTSPDMSDAKIYTTEQTDCSITNLYIGTTYYWQVSFAEDGITYESAVASFTTTDQGPRNLKVEGVTNFRDIGGWKTKSGRTVKQGMIYRTGRVDHPAYSSEEAKQIIKQVMLEELGIKTEIDLRPGMSKSGIGGVKFINCGCADTATLPDLKAALIKIFDVLADESNYPVFIHCNIGTDRTGGVAFIINALLGVDEEDLYRDYCFSNFGKISSDDATGFTPRTADTIYGKIVYFLKKQTGKTLQEKTRNYLLSIGISEETLNAVVRLLRE